MYDMQSSMLYVDSTPCTDYAKNLNTFLDNFDQEDMGKRNEDNEIDMSEKILA